MAFLGGTRVVPVVTTHYINNQSKSGITPSTSSQIIRPDEDYTGLSQVTINAIPASYIIPSGTYTVTNSGTYNISTYASVSTPAMANPTWTAATLNSSAAKVVYSITLSSGFKSTSQTFSSSYTLPTVTGTTITPSDTSQVAVQSYKWTTGSVIIGAIPSTITIYKKIYEKTIVDDELNIYLSTQTQISSYMFIGCNNLSSSIYGNNITSIGMQAFQSCSNLKSVSFPNVTYIYSSTFFGCSLLTTANFPEVTSISGSAFQDCRNLRNLNFPKLKIIGQGVFSKCYSLTSIFFPSVTSLGGNVFYYCSSITSVNLPELISVTGLDTFSYCIGLITVTFPKLTKLGGDMFWYCSNLTTLSLPAASYLCSNSTPFRGCKNLISLYLMNSSMTLLSYSTVFSECPIGNSSYTGSFGSIYVPTSLLTSYKTATNWSYFSDRFVGI